MKIGLLKKILKGSAYVFVLKMIGAAAFFFVTLLISRCSGPAVLGKFQILSKIILIVSIFTTLGLDIFVVRKIPEIEQYKFKTILFIKNSLKVIAILSALVFLFMVPFTGFLERSFFKSGGMKFFIIMTVGTVFFYSVYSYLCQLFRGFGSIKAYSFFRYSWLNVFLLSVLIVNVIFLNEINEVVVFSSYLSTIILSAIFIVFYTRRYLGRKRFDNLQTLKDDVPFVDDIRKSIPIMLSSSLSLVFSYSSIFILGYYTTEYFVGIYSAISQFMLIFTYVSISIASYSAPIIAKKYLMKDSSGLRSIYLNSILLGGIVLVPIFIVIAFFPAYILEVTFGKEFSSYSGVMTILSVGYFINALTGPTITTMNMTDRQNNLLIFSIINTVIFFLTCFLLAKRFGITGVAVATSFSNGFFNILLFIYIYRNLIRNREKKFCENR